MQATHTISVLFCFFVIICFCVAENMMVGGQSEVKSADEETQNIADQIRGEVQTKIGKVFPQFKVVQYKTQMVAGVNYFMKIAVEDDKYIHIRVFKPLPHTGEEPSLISFQEEKTQDDPISYF
ncbi:cystatin-B-like [Mizuhopecten yessoensis]|uniref:Cystatin-B n=1 Tax=Mizuhopecten yessoensis TaxID=6573 RepID=A0A210QHJ7_MIZYE|nr:cystatin-B-like [Mizuhopecten yessoensis]OWF48255.1 Cystatin-B [Mizuhopecten yessoensis]